MGANNIFNYLRNKSAKSKSILSIILCLAVISIYFIPGFVSAVSVEFKTDKSIYSDGNDIVKFDMAVDIQDAERIPIQNLTLSVNGNLKSCIFQIDGTPISGCQNMLIVPSALNTKLAGQLSATGFGSVNGSPYSNSSTDFGFGYGIESTNARQGFNGELAYTIFWNITADGVLDGNYNANLFAHASNGDTDAIYKKKNDVNFLVEKNTSGCFSSLQQLPASCSVGQVVSDSFDFSCRQIVCSDGISNTTALACEKPDNSQNKSYFEMYTTSHFGSNVEVCIANSTCVNSVGFTVSPNYPICIGQAPAAANATLNVTKVVINDNGGTKNIFSFPLFINGTQVASGALNSLPQGTYLVSESSNSNYTASFSGDCAPNGIVNLSPSDSKKCIITNDDVAPRLTVTKIVSNLHGGNKQVSDFNLFVNSTQVTSGVQNAFNKGEYLVSEAQNFNYSSNITGDCDATGKVSLDIGQVKQCNITNTDINFTSPNATCANNVFQMPQNCTGGVIVLNTTASGCRKIICQNGGNSLTILACDKPGTSNAQFFEMYRQAASGINPKICLGTTCIQTNGYAKSPTLPICQGPPQGPFCGDGVVNQPSEQCDGSAGVGANQTCTNTCQLQNVTPPVVPSGNTTLTIKKFFPQGKNYVFICNATSFNPTFFDWAFGDGQKQLNSNSNNVYHTYTTSGSKTVGCTARNSTFSSSASLNIVVA